jgi:hypothetical protein
VIDPVSTIQPAGLICAECNRQMRRRGVKAADAPGTVAYGHSGKCNSCISSAARTKAADDEVESEKEKALRKAEDPVRMSETVAALESWMSWRRGTNREKKNPIRYAAEPQAERIAA